MQDTENNSPLQSLYVILENWDVHVKTLNFKEHLEIRKHFAVVEKAIKEHLEIEEPPEKT